MADQAQVTSVEAIEAFRASLIIYLGKARAALDEVGAEVNRTRAWVQTDQRRKWEQELKLRLRRREEARNELFSAQLSSLHQAGAMQFLAVQRAERAVQEAEAKLVVLKKWGRAMHDQTEPLTKQIEQLQGFLTTDMAKAAAHLALVVRTLDAYAGVAAPAPEGKAPPP